jgi:phosphoenolpyruvate carboxylase
MAFIPPKCMSTQHPDNATAPSYAIDGVIKGEGEIVEASDIFALGADEQMWDSEGKDADNRVVQKLLANYPEQFKKTRLGRDAVITLRVPNPSIELEMRKSLVEALQGIPAAYDMARGFYGGEAGDLDAPIQEVILPMTTNAPELTFIATYYERFIVGQEDQELMGGRTVQDWIGEFHPKTLRVIPLVEDLEHMLTADAIVGEYLQGRGATFQRVFLARSDPALNYGSTAADLMVKVALQRLHRLEQTLGIPIYPIIGAGSVPFRGHLSPVNLERAFREYPSIHTYTIQSAFKFDHPVETVREAIGKIREHERTEPRPIDEKRARQVIDKLAAAYQHQVKTLAPFINAVSAKVPRRRDRKLHVGLFGYGRSLEGNSDVTLPRAIAFAAAAYSMGVPPELLGIAALSKEDLAWVREVYPSLDEDMAAALRFANEKQVHDLLGESYVKQLGRFGWEIDRVHEGLTSAIWAGMAENSTVNVRSFIEDAAGIRKFLG